MRCRRCKTNFDYESHYGICPKCAAYNRPDGKDEILEVMGEGAKAFQEEYHPPVMSSGNLEEFVWKEETDKKSTKGKKQTKKTYQERLSNPYLDETAKKKQQKQKNRTKPKKKGKGLWKVLLVLGIILVSIISEMDEYDWYSLENQVKDLFEVTPELGADLTQQGETYSETFEVCGRKISFGVPYELYPEGDSLSDGESLLIIPYCTEITDPGLNSSYAKSCYLTYDGLYLRPISEYALEEAYLNADGSGTLEYEYEEGYHCLVFAGKFNGIEETELNLSYREMSKDTVEVIYRIQIRAKEPASVEAVWEKTYPEKSLENGFSSPSISRLGASYGEIDARDDYCLYKVTQQFENHYTSDLYATEMDLYFTDETGYEEIYIWGAEDEDRDDPLIYYKRKVLPPGEKGTVESVIEISEECKQLSAALFLREQTKEWQASLN